MTDELIARLRRVEGQVRGIQRMVTDSASCSDVLTQLAAARAALDAAGLALLDARLHDCLDRSDDRSETAETRHRRRKVRPTMTALPDTDAFVRFARAHLPSNTERAIYPVLAGAPDREWTAGEVAAAASVSHHEADQALRRFASAGIVDHNHVRGQGHHYRWHPDMDYLRQGGVTGPAIDPVCGMPVPPGAPHTARDGDTEVSFCSLPCLVRWRSDQRRRRSPR